MEFTDRELAAWLDELLSDERMSELESAMRRDESLRARVANLIRDRDQGGHTVGEIWQRERLSCPSRDELAGYLLQTLQDAAASYVEFHIRTIGCRICAANLRDLEENSQAKDDQQTRRRRYFESSAGLLPTDD